MSKTTDNQDEVFDVVDEDDHIIGQATRGEVHKDKKLIHRSIGVAVFNSRGEIYLQQRSGTKDTEPFKWTISCSGHVNVGDNYEETVLRELKEELGLNIFFPISLRAQRNGEERKGSRAATKTLQRQIKIEFVSKYLCHAPNETEMHMLFKAYDEGPFKLHPQEIIKGKFFTRKELNELVKNGEMKLSFMGKMALGKLGWL